MRMFGSCALSLQVDRVGVCAGVVLFVKTFCGMSWYVTAIKELWSHSKRPRLRRPSRMMSYQHGVPHAQT